MPALRDWRFGITVLALAGLVTVIPAVKADAHPKCDFSGGKNEALIRNLNNHTQWTQGTPKITVYGSVYIAERHCYFLLEPELWGWNGDRFVPIGIHYCSMEANNSGASRPAQAYECAVTFNAPRDTTVTSRVYAVAVQPHDKNHAYDYERAWWGKCARFIGVIDHWVEWDENTARPICETQD